VAIWIKHSYSLQDLGSALVPNRKRVCNCFSQKTPRVTVRPLNAASIDAAAKSRNTSGGVGMGVETVLLIVIHGLKLVTACADFQRCLIEAACPLMTSAARSMGRCTLPEPSRQPPSPGVFYLPMPRRLLPPRRRKGGQCAVPMPDKAASAERYRRLAQECLRIAQTLPAGERWTTLRDGTRLAAFGGSTRRQERIDAQFGALSDRLLPELCATFAPSPAAALRQAPVAERPVALPPESGGARHAHHPIS
jgi:hypothetical protein